jgi:hypothetical protein
MARPNRRAVFRDPPPLPEGAPEFLDATSRKFYRTEKKNAVVKMAEYDRMPDVVRRVEHAVGNLRVASHLVSQGVRTAEQAEPVVRRMLEARPRS